MLPERNDDSQNHLKAEIAQLRCASRPCTRDTTVHIIFCAHSKYSAAAHHNEQVGLPQLYISDFTLYDLIHGFGDFQVQDNDKDVDQTHRNPLSTRPHGVFALKPQSPAAGNFVCGLTL